MEPTQTFSEPDTPRGGAHGPRDLPRWLWIGLPLGIVLAQVATRFLDWTSYRRLMHSEFGVIENLTLVVLIVAIVLGVRLFLRRVAVPGKLFGPWMLLLTVGAFYFAGEEASWGYHLFGVEVMGGLKDLNDQQEPNLHNLGGIAGTMLDQAPRLLLTTAAGIGGVLIPLWQRFKGPWSWPTPWIWPTIVCLPSAALAAGSTLPSKVSEILGTEATFWNEQGEYKELFLAMFIMMYLASLTIRLGGKMGGRTAGNASAGGP